MLTSKRRTRSISRTKFGFTLIEVMVALGITATALLLLLASNNVALRRCISSRQTGAAATPPDEPAIPDLQKGAIDHDGWPVG